MKIAVCLLCAFRGDVRLDTSKQSGKLEFGEPSNSQSLRASAHTGVAISWIEAQFLVDEFWKMVG